MNPGIGSSVFLFMIIIKSYHQRKKRSRQPLILQDHAVITSKADAVITANILQPLFNTIWDTINEKENPDD